jgi:hypothetical protein
MPSTPVWVNLKPAQKAYTVEASMRRANSGAERTRLLAVAKAEKNSIARPTAYRKKVRPEDSLMPDYPGFRRSLSNRPRDTSRA